MLSCPHPRAPGGEHLLHFEASRGTWLVSAVEQYGKADAVLMVQSDVFIPERIPLVRYPP
jgi:hypothetical protein